MYIVTIREKGKSEPVFEQVCSCVIGAVGNRKNGYNFTGLSGSRNALITAYASALRELKYLEEKFPGLLDDAIEAANSAELVEDKSVTLGSSFLGRIFGR